MKSRFHRKYTLEIMYVIYSLKIVSIKATISRGEISPDLLKQKSLAVIDHKLTKEAFINRFVALYNSFCFH